MIQTTNEFDWPFEISGFGGGCEQACRDMAKAAVIWLREHPGELEKWRKARDEFHKEFGENRLFPQSMMSTSEKDFQNAIVKVCDDCTGAMFGAAKSHAIAIFELGWDNYCAKVIGARTARGEEK